MSAGTWSAKLTGVNILLSAATWLTVAVSLLFHVRGGIGQRAIDWLQFGLVWGYLVLTPGLCIGGIVLRDRTRPVPKRIYVLLGLWVGTLIGTSFVHL